MARRRLVPATPLTGGAYLYLLDDAELEYELWRASVHDGNGARYWRQARLDDLRAGRPVVVSSCGIPQALGGTQLPRLAGRISFEAQRARDMAANHRLVTVHADNQIVEGGEADIREFLEL